MYENEGIFAGPDCLGGLGEMEQPYARLQNMPRLGPGSTVQSLESLRQGYSHRAGLGSLLPGGVPQIATGKLPWGWIAAGALGLGIAFYFLSKKKKKR